MSKYVGKIITNQAPAGYSVFFDGTGDYLSNTANTIIPTTGDFTFETWVYPTQVSTLQFLIGTTNNSGNKFFIYISSTAYVGVQTGSSYRDSSTTKVVANAWNHIACTRTGSTYALFVNGVSQSISGVGTMASTLDVTPTYIGSRDAGNSPVTGYLSNVRVCNSVLYTAAFTPPTQLLNITGTSLLTCNSPAIVDQSSNAFAITVNGNSAVSTFTPFTAYVPYNPALGTSTPGVWTLDEAMQAAATRQWNMYDPNFQNTTLLLHGNGTNAAQNNTFLDSSSNNFTITRNGNTTQGSFSPFSQTGWSNYFTPSGSQSISAVSGASTSPGTGDFCAELWYYTTSTGSQGIFGNLESNTDTQWAITFVSGTTLRLQGWNTVFVSGNSGALNQWNHVAVCRSGTTMSMFVNGVRVGTATVSNNFSGTSNIRVGGTNGIDYFSGYISNARFVKGSSVYDPTQASITVPTTPLTAITNTQFLTCQSNRFIDNSTNAFAITVAGTPSVQAFSPFYPTAAYTPATIGGSGYSDGNGDYLTGNGSLSTSTSMSTFTVEGWLYPTSLANNYWIIGDMNAVGTTNALSVRTGSNGDLVLYWYDGAGKECFSPNGSIRANQWNWFAIVVNNNAISMYINSTTAASLTGTTTLTNRIETSNFAVSQYNNSVTFLGYISNLRWSSGIARTISSIPTAPYTSDGNTRLLLNFTNAGIVDSTAKNVLETVGNAQISTTQSKFGGSSIAFDGTGDYLFIPQSNNPLNINWELVNGDFTIEFWFRANTVSPTAQGLIVKFNGNAGARTDIQYLISLSGSNLNCNAYQSTANNDITFTSAISINTWYHVAFVRSGNSFSAYLDGARNATVRTITGALNSGTNWPLQIGRYTEGGVNYDFNGYIDDLRITKGIARYTANFTPQTSQWQDQ